MCGKILKAQKELLRFYAFQYYRKYKDLYIK